MPVSSRTSRRAVSMSASFASRLPVTDCQNPGWAALSSTSMSSARRVDYDQNRDGLLGAAHASGNAGMPGLGHRAVSRRGSGSPGGFPAALCNTSISVAKSSGSAARRLAMPLIKRICPLAGSQSGSVRQSYSASKLAPYQIGNLKADPSSDKTASESTMVCDVRSKEAEARAGGGCFDCGMSRSAQVIDPRSAGILEQVIVHWEVSIPLISRKVR